MFSKEESAQIRQEFWTSFGKLYPRKWILYKTRHKFTSFKFHFDTKKARVMIEISGDMATKEHYFNRWLSVKEPLKEAINGLIFCDSFNLENGKTIACIYVQKNQVSIHNRDSWHSVMEFFHQTMSSLEDFWLEYEDFLKQDSNDMT